MCVEDRDGAALERLATDTAEDIIQTSDATAHARTQHIFGLLIKRLPEYLRHGQHDMAIDHALMQHLADLADPVVDVDFGAA